MSQIFLNKEEETVAINHHSNGVSDSNTYELKNNSSDQITLANAGKNSYSNSSFISNSFDMQCEGLW